MFVDETSKDGRDGLRRYARSKRGTAAIVKIPFSRGQRISAVAAVTTEGFLGFNHTEGTFTRGSFHESFITHILPHLQPWPLPRSIVIMDNAKIHCYPEIYDVIQRVGAKLIFLPPYSPELNPIETCFAILKAKIKRDCFLAFRNSPYETLRVCLDVCLKGTPNCVANIYQHCGYEVGGLNREVILQDVEFDDLD